MEKNLKQLPSGPKRIIKIALFGPESTGKTTLAKQLAEYYKTDWVPEFARDYLQEKWDNQQALCDINDMLPIAYGQTQLENKKMEDEEKIETPEEEEVDTEEEEEEEEVIGDEVA
jgi:nicotinamide riboside kinase